MGALWPLGPALLLGNGLLLSAAAQKPERLQVVACYLLLGLCPPLLLLLELLLVVGLH